MEECFTNICKYLSDEWCICLPVTCTVGTNNVQVSIVNIVDIVDIVNSSTNEVFSI